MPRLSDCLRNFTIHFRVFLHIKMVDGEGGHITQDTIKMVDGVGGHIPKTYHKDGRRQGCVHSPAYHKDGRQRRWAYSPSHHKDGRGRGWAYLTAYHRDGRRWGWAYHPESQRWKTARWAYHPAYHKDGSREGRHITHHTIKQYKNISTALCIKIIIIRSYSTFKNISKFTEVFVAFKYLDVLRGYCHSEIQFFNTYIR